MYTYTITLKNFGSNKTPGMREFAMEKLNFLEQHIKEGSTIHLRVDKEKNDLFNLGVCCHLNDNTKLNVEITSNNYYTGLDILKDRTKAVLAKHKKVKKSNKIKQLEKMEQNPSELQMPIVTADGIQKRKSFIITNVTEKQAIEHMEMLGHSFYVFYNRDTDDQLAILYKRSDDTFGIISGT